MDKKYQILDHPADLKIKAFGKDLKEVFVNMAAAIADEQLRAQNIKKLKNLKVEEIALESDSLESLFVDWLSEILYRGEVNKKVYTEFKIIEFSEKPCRIKAKIKGVAIESKNIDIKAVTYHDLLIAKRKDGWEAVVTFDI